MEKALLLFASEASNARASINLKKQSLELGLLA